MCSSEAVARALCGDQGAALPCRRISDCEEIGGPHCKQTARFGGMATQPHNLSDTQHVFPCKPLLYDPDLLAQPARLTQLRHQKPCITPQTTPPTLHPILMPSLLHTIIHHSKPSSMHRAKAYAESRAAAERNKRLVAEQEGLYYPQGGQGQAQSPAMFGAFPKAGSPSVDRTLRKIVSNREGGIG